MALTLVGIGTKVSGRSAWLDDPAAGAYKRMLKAGCPTGCITDAGRTGPEQIEIFMARFTTDYARSAKYDKRLWRGVAWWRKVGATNAATPGTSNHETGRALDLAEPARSWVRAHGAAYGWLKDRVRNEPWHMEYVAVHDTTPAQPGETDTPTPTPEPRRRDVLIIKDVNGTAHFEATELAVRHITDVHRLGSLILAYGPVVDMDAADIQRLIWQADDRRRVVAAALAEAIPAGDVANPKAVADELARRLTA